MQSTASPIALLAGLQGAAASDEFAALLNRGALPEETSEQGEPAVSNAAATATPAPVNEAVPAPAVAALAIAHADALVATLAPAPERVETPAEPKNAAPVQIALPVAMRPVARRDAPSSLPKEELDEDHQDAKQEADDTAPATPAIVALPESAGTERPVDAPAVSSGSLETASAKRAAAAMKMREMTDHTGRSEKAEREIGSIPPDELPGLAKSAKIEAKPVPAETASADRRAHMDLLASTQPQPVSTQKAAPARASKVAEIALALADRLPDPTAAIAQKQAADMPTPVPVTSGTNPASPADMVVDRQLDLVRNEQWLGELAHDIASTSGDNNRLSFRLMPHQLGRLDVDVSRSHNGLSLSIHTESDSAQAILSAAQPRLADEIRAQGLKLADTQMFSGDARHSPGHDGQSRPAPLIETFTTFTETVDVPEPEQRDGRYA